MECNECKMSEANEQSGLCDSCEKKSIGKINGWLILPAMGLIISIIGGAAGIVIFFIVTISPFNDDNLLFYYSLAVLISMTLWLLVTLYASWFFFRRKKGTRKAMIIFYLSGLLFSLFVGLLPAIISDSRPDEEEIKLLISGIVGAVIWVPYFLFSKRIDRVFFR